MFIKIAWKCIRGGIFVQLLSIGPRNIIYCVHLIVVVLACERHRPTLHLNDTNPSRLPDFP